MGILPKRATIGTEVDNIVDLKPTEYAVPSRTGVEPSYLGPPAWPVQPPEEKDVVGTNFSVS